jgi:hypothetical protein
MRVPGLDFETRELERQPRMLYASMRVPQRADLGPRDVGNLGPAESVRTISGFC